MKVTAANKKIEQLFSPTGVRYLVPRYQREYCWGEEEITRLWEDIQEHLSVNNGQADVEYFIGSLVLIKPSDAQEIYYIIDGQQRLTTIVIFISVIIEFFKSLQEDGKARGLHKYIEGYDKDNKPFFKLQNETAIPYFQENVQKFEKESFLPDSPETKCLADAYQFANKFINDKSKSLNDEQYLHFLDTLRDQILNLAVIQVIVDNEEDAYTIFETLNSTGKDLTAVDLVKNHIFRVLDNQHPIDFAKERWKELNEQLQQDSALDINQFLLHFWASKFPYTGQKQIYKKFKEQFPITKKIEVRNFLIDFVKEAPLYKKISSPEESDWSDQEYKEVLFSLRALKVFGVEQPRIFLLGLFDCFSKAQLTSRQFVDTLKFLENFHFIFNAICSLRPSGIDIKFSKYSILLRNAKSHQDAGLAIQGFMNELIEKKPDKLFFIDHFMALEYSKRKTKYKKIIQYIFFKLETFYRKDLTLLPYNFTLEHILSQSEGNKDPNLKSYIYNIGNIIPLDKALNDKVKNGPFVDKLEQYKNSNLIMVKNFIEYCSVYEINEWDSDMICDRAQELAEIAYDLVWKV
jgi:uncharacterized protein with ParB-like and HNH nuclease domain